MAHTLFLAKYQSLTKHSKFLDYDFLKHFSIHLNDSVQLLSLRRQTLRVHMAQSLAKLEYGYI